MPTTVPGEVLAPSTPLRQEAERIEKKILEIKDTLNRKWAEIGWLALQVRQKELWRVRGFKSENDYRAFLGIGRSTWYASIRTAELLDPIGRDTMLKLTRENAEQLCLLNEEDRKNPKWIERALKLKEEEFAPLITKKRATYGDEPEVEARVWFKVRMGHRQKKKVDAAMDQFNAQYGLDGDKGRALEIMAAEATNGVGVMAVLARCLPSLKEVIKLRKSNKSVDEVAEEMFTAVESVVKELAKVVR